MEKNYICYFQKGDSPGSLNLWTIDIETKLKIDKYSYEILSENVLNYFKNIPEFIKNFAKAVIFKHLTEFENLSFKNSPEFVRFILSEFKKLNIPIRFIDCGTFSLTRLLIAAKIDPKFDRNILFILVVDGKIFVEELHRTKEGYAYPPTKALRCIKFHVGYDLRKIKEEILENIKFNKIYIAELTSYFQNILDVMLKIFGRDKYLNCSEKNENETIVEIALQLFDKKRNWYYIIPRYSFTVKNSEYKNSYAIMWQVDEGLPFKESFMDSRKSGTYYIERYYFEQKEAEIVQIYPILKKQCHKIKLTLTVDINLKPSLTQEAYIEPKIKSLPKILTEKMDSKIPVIAFFENSSIICFWNKKEECYKFSEKWNGLYGEDLYISFNKEKPKFRNEAYKVLKEKPTFVVYDLLDISASKIDNFHTCLYWQFLITKDEENPILIEFDNFDGSRKNATPELLMALLIKDHLKIIKEEMGKKPAEIGFVFIDKNKNEEFFDHSILLERIKESCNLLKIKCKIVEI